MPRPVAKWISLTAISYLEDNLKQKACLISDKILASTIVELRKDISRSMEFILSGSVSLPEGDISTLVFLCEDHTGLRHTFKFSNVTITGFYESNGSTNISFYRNGNLMLFNGGIIENAKLIVQHEEESFYTTQKAITTRPEKTDPVILLLDEVQGSKEDLLFDLTELEQKIDKLTNQQLDTFIDKLQIKKADSTKKEPALNFFQILRQSRHRIK